MKINNKDLIQSYILTTAKYDYSIYEKRILYRIIEMMQLYTQGRELNKKYSIQQTIFNDLDIKMPINAFLKDEKDTNYDQVKKALLSLNEKVIQYEDENKWKAFNLIERPEVEKNEGFIQFRVSPWIARAFIDFSKGYSKYELETAMKFGSVYSMRFYELLSNQKKPITYSIESLKIMFKIENKYKNANNFIKKVLETAKKELDEKSPYTFTYETARKGRAFSSIKFYPIYQEDKRDSRIEKIKNEKKISLYWDLTPTVINYLKENYLFSNEEIKNNRKLFSTAQKHESFDLIYFLSEQKRTSEEKKNPKGWIINAIKKQLEQINQKESTDKPKLLKFKEMRNNEPMAIKDILTEKTFQKQ